MDLFTLSASLGLDITNFEGGINTARRLLLQFAGAVVDFGTDVIETGMGFDKQMSAVQAVMGLTENTAENLATMNRLREFALEQARDSIFTSEEAATAYYYMGMAGWRAEQMVAGLPGIMALAAASGEDLKMTSDMVTDSLTAFGLGAGQASRFADVLAVTATNANTDVARMQQTFKNLAPIAGALGYSIEDVALSVGLIANAGVKGSQAGTALRNIFTRIATNAGETEKNMGALRVVTDKLGVSFYTAEGRARPWGEVLTELRTAWSKLDPSEVDKVTAAFGQFSVDGQNADEVMSEFADDLDTWTTAWNGLTTNADRENFASQLEPQFTALGVSMRDSNGQLREFSEVAKDARVKLGGLSDEEQTYYAKQIGSLRGISGWLALMTASEDDVKQLTEAIENADGAAQAMADTRLDNLWGDVIHFNSVLDTLKISIYDVVKGPMREIVQYGSDALVRITEAINKDGLAGGIEQLGIEIEGLGEKLAPMMEALGASLAPLVSSLLENVLPALGGAAIELGVSLGKGILQGIKEAVGETVVADIIDQILNGGGVGGVLKVVENALFGKNQKYTGTDLGVDINTTEMGRIEASTIAMRVQTNAEDIQAAIDEAGGAAELEINNVTMPTEQWQAVVNALTSEPLEFDVDSETIASDLTTATEGPFDVGLSADTGSLVSSIASTLAEKTFSINVNANVTGLPSSQPAEKYAKSMYGGTILHGATVFGANANGQPLIGGEAGPEAIVGVNSLNAMIQGSVNSAMKPILSRLDKLIAKQGSRGSTRVYLDGRELSSRMTEHMNRALGSANEWQRSGHA